MGFFAAFSRRGKTVENRGHVRVTVDPATLEIRGVDVVSALLDDEAAPALKSAMLAFDKTTSEQRAARIDVAMNRAKSDLGMSERLLGKASRYEAEARAVVGRENFKGSAGNDTVVVTVSGFLSTVDVRVRPGAHASEAVMLFRDAWKNAVDAALSRWQAAAKGALEKEAAETSSTTT